MSIKPPIDVDQLPPASTFLNYPRAGLPVGSYVGPTTMGEYLTVVSNETPGLEVARPEPTQRCVGLAYGCYLVNGQPTDSDGLPPEVHVLWIQRQWQAAKNLAARPPRRSRG